MDGGRAARGSGEAVKEAIPTRELISVVSNGVCLRGTYHKPVACADGRRVGILIPNGGVAPRAGMADASVYWADWLSQRGFPVFRFDLPGLGDSDRDPAAAGIDFQAHADTGGYGPWLSDIMSRIVTRFELAGLVLLAHCSGGVTAIFAASANQHSRGLILLDPYFHFQPESDGQSAVTSLNRRVFRNLARDWSAHPLVRATGLRVISCLRKIYHGLSRTRVFVRRKKLPEGANLPLIRCWNQLASAGVPMLVLRSDSYAPRAGRFDYIDYLAHHSSRGLRMTLKPVDGASHAFAERVSIEAVAKSAEEWLNTCFPFVNRFVGEESGRRSPELAHAAVGLERNVH
jgi:alpha-beta hydrolase superfamily lysophospholipase